jgi:predicted RNA-binding protein with PIN domain
MTADSVIERMVAQAQDPGGILVVSSDRGERYTVGAAGALTMSCRNFIGLIKECRHMLSQRLAKRARRPSPGPSLGDFFPGSRLS